MYKRQDVDVAVADVKNFVLAVNVGDLVHKTVVLGAPQDLQHLVVKMCIRDRM